MNLREYAAQQTDTQPEPSTPKAQAIKAPVKSKPASDIENEYRINTEIATGCRLQILKDIEQKQNPYRMLLTAAEAIGRQAGQGDSFFLQVQSKLIEVYGKDIAEENQAI